MGVRPLVSMAQVSPAEMEQLVTRAGLKLNAGQMADLVLAWRQLVQIVGTIPRERGLADDQAYAFRLPSPQRATKQPAPKRPPPKQRAAAKPRPVVKRAASSPKRGKPAARRR